MLISGQDEAFKLRLMMQGYSPEDVYTFFTKELHVTLAFARQHQVEDIPYVLFTECEITLGPLEARGHDGHGDTPVLTGAYDGSLSTKVVLGVFQF